MRTRVYAVVVGEGEVVLSWWERQGPKVGSRAPTRGRIVVARV